MEQETTPGGAGHGGHRDTDAPEQDGQQDGQQDGHGRSPARRSGTPCKTDVTPTAQDSARQAEGVRDSAGAPECVCLVDYVVCAFPAGPGTLDAVRALVGGRWHASGAPRRAGYLCHVRRGGIALHHNGVGGSAAVELTGAGCRQAEHEQGFTGEDGWRAFLAILARAGGTFRRIDWAFDSLTGLFDIGIAERYLRDGACVTPYHSGDITDTIRPSTGESMGKIIRLGARRSAVCIRMYDKAAEQARRRKGPMVNGPWVRVETETKGRCADAFAVAFIVGGWALIRADLEARVNFKTRQDGDTNRSRWPTCPWWRRFLGQQDKRKIVERDGTEHLAALAAYLRDAVPGLQSPRPPGAQERSWLDTALNGWPRGSPPTPMRQHGRGKARSVRARGIAVHQRVPEAPNVWRSRGAAPSAFRRSFSGCGAPSLFRADRTNQTRRMSCTVTSPNASPN